MSNDALEEEVSRLLKAATAEQKGGNPDQAIKLLHRAYGLMAKSPISRSIETYLRLPLYLQKDGRFDEAMVEFDAVLSAIPAKIAREFAHCGQTTQRRIVATDRSIVYDKMRLACQREKRPERAVMYAVFSHAERCLGLEYQRAQGEHWNDGYEEEYQAVRSRESWEKIVAKLFRIGLAIDKEKLLRACDAFVEAVSANGLAALVKKVEEIVAASVSRDGS